MGYIRDNEDYYRSLGYSAERARVEAALDRRGYPDDCERDLRRRDKYYEAVRREPSGRE